MTAGACKHATGLHRHCPWWPLPRGWTILPTAVEVEHRRIVCSHHLRPRTYTVWNDKKDGGEGKGVEVCRKQFSPERPKCTPCRSQFTGCAVVLKDIAHFFRWLFIFLEPNCAFEELINHLVHANTDFQSWYDPCRLQNPQGITIMTPFVFARIKKWRQIKKKKI